MADRGGESPPPTSQQPRIGWAVRADLPATLGAPEGIRASHDAERSTALRSEPETPRGEIRFATRKKLEAPGEGGRRSRTSRRIAGRVVEEPAQDNGRPRSVTPIRKAESQQAGRSLSHHGRAGRLSQGERGRAGTWWRKTLRAPFFVEHAFSFILIASSSDAGVRPGRID